MKVFNLEAAIYDEDDVDREPLRIRIWADHCKVEQGPTHRTLFLTADNKVVAEIRGRTSQVDVQET